MTRRESLRTGTDGMPFLGGGGLFDDQARIPPHRYRPEKHGICTFSVTVGCFNKEQCWAQKDDPIHLLPDMNPDMVGAIKELADPLV